MNIQNMTANFVSKNLIGGEDGVGIGRHNK